VSHEIHLSDAAGVFNPECPDCRTLRRHAMHPELDQRAAWDYILRQYGTADAREWARGGRLDPPRPALIQASYFARPMLRPRLVYTYRVFRDTYPRAEGKLEGLAIDVDASAFDRATARLVSNWPVADDRPWPPVPAMQPTAVHKMTLGERWDRWLLGGPWW